MRMTNDTLARRAAAALVLTACAAILPAGTAAAQIYDPLAIAGQARPEPIDLTVTDGARKRDIPVRIYLPSQTSPAAVVLFSHGLGGSRDGNPYLGTHWAARGYAAVFLQHAGSDDAVWKDVPQPDRLRRLGQAANLQNALLRFQDVPAVLDQLAHWNGTGGHALSGRLDLTRIGMSGHSFGAVTTQAVSGQRDRSGKASFTDGRIRAAVIMSPNAPRAGDANGAFAGVDIPWLLMTGTRDIAVVGDADMASRLAVFPALPKGGKYELLLDRAEHSAFGDRALPGDQQARNPNHHRAILALSTAFWDAWLLANDAAKSWLNGNGPLSVLEPGDRWQIK